LANDKQERLSRIEKAITCLFGTKGDGALGEKVKRGVPVHFLEKG
jgi:hypothetical protein